MMRKENEFVPSKNVQNAPNSQIKTEYPHLPLLQSQPQRPTQTQAMSNLGYPHSSMESLNNYPYQRNVLSSIFLANPMLSYNAIPNPYMYCNQVATFTPLIYPPTLTMGFFPRSRERIFSQPRPMNMFPPLINQMPLCQPIASASSIPNIVNLQSQVKTNPSQEDKNDDSLEHINEPKSGKGLVKGISYESRNVYKSLIRHIFSYTRKNRETIVEILLQSGYVMSEVEHAFYKINCYNELEREKAFKKKAQATIRKMMGAKTIYTYILRETLNALLINWNKGKLGKISERNYEVYKEVCGKFYQETVQIIGEPAKGKTFKL